MFELAHREAATASELAKELGLDPGYLSRTLKKLEDRGLLTRTPSADDARQQRLAPDGEGRSSDLRN